MSLVLRYDCLFLLTVLEDAPHEMDTPEADELLEDAPDGCSHESELTESDATTFAVPPKLDPLDSDDSYVPSPQIRKSECYNSLFHLGKKVLVTLS